MFNRKNDLLKGPVLKELLLFTLPLFLSNLFQQLYNTVDTIIVGNHLGEMSLAAIGASMAIYQLLIGFSFGFGGGFGIVVARAFGSGDEDMLKKSVAGALTIGTAVVCVVMLIAGFFMEPLLVLLKTPEAIMEPAYNYIILITMFAGIAFLYNLTSGLLRAIGNSLMPLLFLVLASLLNIVLDVLFVIVMEWGIEGAAIATIIAQSVSLVLSLIYIWRKEHELIPERKHFRMDKELFNELFGQGMSMAMMFSFVTIGTVILQYAINQMGFMIIAAHTTSRRLIMFFMMPMSSLSLSNSTFVSQNKGADQGKRILQSVRYSNILCISWSLFITAVVMFFAEDMMRLTSGSTEAEVIINGSNALKFNVAFFVVVGVLFVTRYGLQGLGEKVTPLTSSVIELVLKLAFVILVIPHMGYWGVIICEPLIWVVMTAQLLYAFNQNRYIRRIRLSG